MDWIELLKNFAFPVCCVIYLFYDRRVSDTQHKEEVDALRVSFNETAEKMTEALNNNTNVLSRILEKIGINGELKK